MPDYMVAADLDALERLLGTMSGLRLEGYCTSLIYEIYQATDTLDCLRQASAEAHHPRIEHLARGYDQLLQTIVN